MNKQLSQRLSACLNALSSFKTIADIGTDHAYLPCIGITQNIIDKAIAIDVIDGPLEMARRTINSYGLEKVIELRKGSGLAPLKIGEVEAANIAGMGGNLIAKLITDNLEIAKSLKMLALQPQGAELNLRKTLNDNRFEILNEVILEDEGLIYIVISARYNEDTLPLTDEQLQFGPTLLKNPQATLFQKKWLNEVSAIKKMLKKIPDHNPKRSYFQQELLMINEVLNRGKSE